MRIVLHLSGIVLVVVCATWAYRVNYATQEALNRVAEYLYREETITGEQFLEILRPKALEGGEQVA